MTEGKSFPGLGQISSNDLDLLTLTAQNDMYTQQDVSYGHLFFISFLDTLLFLLRVALKILSPDKLLIYLQAPLGTLSRPSR